MVEGSAHHVREQYKGLSATATPTYARCCKSTFQLESSTSLTITQAPPFADALLRIMALVLAVNTPTGSQCTSELCWQRHSHTRRLISFFLVGSSALYLFSTAMTHLTLFICVSSGDFHANQYLPCSESYKSSDCVSGSPNQTFCIVDVALLFATFAVVLWC